MDTKFQTSFIPKKPIISNQNVVRHSGGTSVFMFISVLVFLASLGAAGFSIFWKNILNNQQENYRNELIKAEKRFDLPLIEKLRKANTKIDLADKLLKKHIASSEIFSIISQLTSEGISFNSFEFVAPVNYGEEERVIMKGVGSSLSAIAWQSKVFGESEKYGKNKVIKNPILSDLVLNSDGSVGFNFMASIKPEDILYDNVLSSKTKTTDQ